MELYVTSQEPIVNIAVTIVHHLKTKSLVAVPNYLARSSHSFASNDWYKVLNLGALDTSTCWQETS